MKVTLSNIGKRYESHWIFKEINTEFSSGSIYGLVGNNGSGKSTLLQIISGFVTPTNGSLSYAHEGDEIQIEQWYKYLSIAAPYLELFDEFTVEESVKLQEQFFPFSEASTDMLIKDIDLWNHRSKSLKHLSSGMRQRLKLALAIYAQSPILLLDEPCSNLDARWMDWYNECLQAKSKDRLVIVCSNRQESELKSVNQELLDLSAHHAR